MKKLNISIDVGGTHSRLQCQIEQEGNILETSCHNKQTIKSKPALEKFITQSVASFSDQKPNSCVIGFAGAVIDRNYVKITNWKDKPQITRDDLLDWGMPENTFMVNDMELAAYGLLAMKEADEIPSEECKILYMPENLSQQYAQNMLVIAPGTGFGTGSIVETPTASGESFQQVISSEVQHVQIPPLDETHAKMIQIILGKKEDRYYLNYEDFVSGYGLEDTYNALLRLNGKKPNKKTAADIAREAVAGSDEIAMQTLDYFYRITGRLIQTMSLVIQPYGGIFLCGTSTVRNAEFIAKSGLLEEVHKSMVRKELLEQFPIFIVTRENINIEGGLWAGSKLF
ncbi:MAG: glucokinase [Candidatus Cloacimonetes bacterium]|nr:glucokinase [Candidatus Cloacimonadota bacterium]MCF7814263.1 glucokinase [Candidatus Cloacimonadota bacterium]MCF7868924.1 glucokinase [Candidatus Cloacimonadota bacterium]MCF7884305.1 glucokinase [Candidatus Cloacimonadota bacterium]